MTLLLTALLPLLLSAVASSDGGPQVSIQSVDDATVAPASAVLTVLDASSQPVVGLRPEQVVVQENGRPGRTIGLERAVDSQVGIGVVLAIQTSSSMASTLPDVRAAAKALIASLSPKDQASIVSFANEVRVEQPMTADRDALGAALDRLQAAGNTVLYDAVVRSVDEASHGPLPRKVVILLTDAGGVGRISQATREMALDRAGSSGVTVYALGFGTVVDGQFLEELAQRGRGRALVAPTLPDVTKAYADLAELLRSQYVLRFDSPAPVDEKDRSLTIVVTVPEGSGQATFSYRSKREAPPSAPPTAAPAPEPMQAAAPATSSGQGRSPLVVVLPVVAAGSAALLTAAWLVLRLRKRRVRRQVALIRRDLQVAQARRRPDAPDQRASLKVLTGPLAGKIFPVGADVVTMGCAPTCTVELAAVDGLVAPEHARVWWRDDKLMLHHIAKGQTTAISGRPASWATLEPGDIIEMGPYRILVEVG